MNNKLKKDNKNIIMASEIAQYQYCSIAWKLTKQGYRPKSELLDIGRNKHEAHGKLIQFSEKLLTKSKILILIGCLLLFFAILIIITEIL
jgi:hypothetical protein